MATKVETNKSGIKKDKKSDPTVRELTSIVDKKEKRQQDGDAEAGIDPQVDQLNTMPNDPNTRPKEKHNKTDKNN